MGSFTLATARHDIYYISDVMFHWNLMNVKSILHEVYIYRM